MNTRSVKKQQFIIPLGDENVAVNLQASRRKSLKLQLNAQGEVEVRIPLGMPKAMVLNFLSKNNAWLIEQRQRFVQNQQQRSQQFYWQGRALSFQPAKVLQLELAEHSCVYPEQWDDEQLLQQLDVFLRKQAYQHYEAMIERWWPLFASFGKRPVLRVKKMRTRWGSLSKRGYINLNLALLSLPIELCELVIVHELCHLKHFDHGPGFKALMRQCLPEVDELNARLVRWEKALLF